MFFCSIISGSLLSAALLLSFGSYASNIKAIDSAKFDEYRFVDEPYKKYITPGELTVVATFDGSKSLSMWENVLTFAKSHGVKFTFFASGVYLLPDSRKNDYKLPYNTKSSGISDIDFGGTEQDVKDRTQYIHRAIKEGHDIESHLNGHFSGSKWDAGSWESEFRQFDKIMALFPKARYVRFPLLEQNNEVYKVMAKLGYKGIVSSWRGRAMKDIRHVFFMDGDKERHIIEYPIYFVESDDYATIVMDYNLYYTDTERKSKLTPGQIEEKVYQLYMKVAQECFEASRPMFFNHHFSLWAGGAYWKAMQRAIIDIKKKYKVQFLTVSELSARVEKESPNV